MLQRGKVFLMMCVFLVSGAMEFADGETAAAESLNRLVVEENTVYRVTETMHLHELILEDGGTLIPPDGYNLILKVNGKVPGHQEDEGVFDFVTELKPGRYIGNVVITVSPAAMVDD